MLARVAETHSLVTCQSAPQEGALAAACRAVHVPDCRGRDPTNGTGTIGKYSCRSDGHERHLMMMTHGSPLTIGVRNA